MLRLLRITGILFFAVLIGFTANRLQGLFEDGTLFDRYNSARKANITLLVVSTFGLIILGFFEFYRARRRLERRGYATVEKDENPIDEGLDTASIYSSSKIVDPWDGRRTRTSRSRDHKKIEPARIWFGVLRIYSVVLPVVYFYALINYLLFWLPSGGGNTILTILLPSLLLLSVATSYGLLKKKTFGLHCGYGIAIFHLLLFPWGTAAGLILLVGLVGATSEFAIPAREHRRKTMQKKAKRTLASILA